MTKVVVICGLGGVGKTTVSAALGLQCAIAGQRVCVLTIDPARRLADAIGVPLRGTSPTRIPISDVDYSAVMLDRKEMWDQLIREHSPTTADAEALLANRYYTSISTKLTGSHEYMAIELLYKLVHSGAFDTIILDTPPTQHAEDFLIAPRKVQRLLDHRLAGRLLRNKTRNRLLGGFTNRAGQLFERLAGHSVLNDISEFYRLFANLAAGFLSRHRAMEEYLKSASTSFYLVLNPANHFTDEPTSFVSRLRTEKMQFAGVIFNRCTHIEPPPTHNWDEITAKNSTENDDLNLWKAFLIEKYTNQVSEARTSTQQLHDIAKLVRAPKILYVPELEGGVSDITNLRKLAEAMTPID
jgi:anion-transporting  ArsA/GET3 family ATPase